MKCSKLLLVAVGATVLFSALIGSASARSFSTTSQTFRKPFRDLRFSGALGNITCSVTLEGSLHTRTIAKTAGALIGYITRADIGVCPEGRATILRETLPWHLRYSSFTGALPGITTIRESIIGASARIAEPLASCLFRSTPESPVTLTFNRNTSTGALETAEAGGSIATSCGTVVTITSNQAAVTALNSVTRITVTLI